MASSDAPVYTQYPPAVIVPAYELSETALKLSRVIEREAQRRSAVRGNGFRVEQNFPVFQRMSSRLRSSVARSKRSVTVAPTMDPDGKPPPMGSPSSLVGGPLEPIPGSPRSSMKAQRSIAQTQENNSTGSEDGFEPMSCRERVWVFFDDPQSSVAAYYFSISLFFFIAMSTVIFIAQTEKSLDQYKSTLDTMEAICAGVFTVEYGLRALSAPSKWGFMKNLGNWIDLAAILPFYLEAIVMVENAGSFGAIRIVRLTRVARVLKMSRYSSAIQVFVQAIAISIKALSMLLFLMAIAVVVFSSAIYFAEYTADGCRHGGWIGQCSADSGSGVTLAVAGSLGAAAAAGASVTVGLPAQCVCIDPNPYSSIASSFWWSIVTMSTVGYGDMVPVTLAGRIVGVATILTGMLVLALPITVIGTNFQKVMKSVMQQTMKNNVDYLKGKKQICRQEIKAILQRFHAVTEDIHLSIDDVIAVYDTDNSGTLEDEELRRFRHDLEMLQNRAYMNMNMDLGAHAATAVAVASPPNTPHTSTRLLGTMIKKLSSRSPSFLLPAKAEPTPSATPSPSPSPTQSSSPSPPIAAARTPFPSAAKPETHFRSTFSLGSTALPMARPPLPEARLMIRANTQPSNISAPPPAESSRGPETERAEIPHSVVEDIQEEDSAQPVKGPTAPAETATAVVASGPHIDEILEEELENAMRSTSFSPDSSHIPDSQASSPSHSSSHRHQHHRHGHHHSHSQSHGPHLAPRGVSQSARASHDASHDYSDDDVVLMRIMEMQRAFEDRLKETEARIDSKLLNLTKILMRVENLIEMDD